jgi:hypothetical protein
MRLLDKIWIKGWLLTIPLLFALVVVSAQAIRYSRFYDFDSGAEILTEPLQLNDGSVLAIGVTGNSNGTGYGKGYHVLVDSLGTQLFSYSYAPIGKKFRPGGLVLYDGTIYSSGNICDYSVTSPSPCDFYFARLDETGDTLFTKIYERKDTCDLLLDMVQTRPNKIMLIGWTCNDTTQNNTELMFITVDTLGNEVNRVVWGLGGTDYIHSGLVINEMGEVLMTGWRAQNTWVVKTDSIGNVLWNRSYNMSSGGGGDGGGRVLALSDGNFVILGGSANSATGTSDGYILKIDPMGEQIWAKKYVPSNGSQSLWSGVVLEDGTIVACGQTTNTADDSQAGWLVKTDANGDTLWTRTYNPSSLIDRLLNMLVMPNGDIVMVGSGRAPGQTNQDGWILRVDSMGCEVEGCFLTGISPPDPPKGGVAVWPNPANEVIQIDLGEQMADVRVIAVFDAMGRNMTPSPFGYSPLQKGGELLRMDVSGWPNGIYLLTLTDDDGNRYTQRFVVRH